MATIQEMLIAKGIPVTGVTGKSKKAVSPVQTVRFTFKRPPVVPKVFTSQTVEERATAAEALRQFRSEVVASMHDYVGRVRAIDGLDDEDERAMEAGLRKELSDAITTMLSYEPPYREPAMLAYADALVKTCPEFRGPVEATLKSLVEVGFLTEVVDGKGHRIYRKDYVLTKEFSKNADARAVGEALTQLVARTAAGGRERFQADLESIKAAEGDNPLPIMELRPYQGVEGRRLVLETPNHQRGDRTFRGGFLLLESKEGKIRVLDGAGGCQRIARQLAEAGTFIWNTQLGSERLELKERLSEEIFSNVRILHGLIFRGIAAAEEAEAADQRKEAFKAKTAAEREVLKAKATLSPVEYFLLEQAGTGVLDPLGGKPFKVYSREKGKDPTLIWGVIALIERDDRNRVRVADCPERLNEFFADFREFVPAGERFAGIKWPLMVLLRMGYAAALKAATAEQKAEAQGARAQAEAARKATKAEADRELAADLAAGSGENLSGLEIPDPNEGRR